MEDRKITKFEFLLTLEDHIVCQRFFNVKGYKPVNIRSLNLYDTVNDIKSDIMKSLKMKSTDYLLSLYNPYIYTVNLSEQDLDEAPKEYFNIYIKLNNEVVSHRIFPAWIYPGKVRYTVDIRPFLGRILRELTDVLSAEKVERKYLETTL
jgi:CRISPR/Cas system-associated protein Cas10 (large subunit of type III CRISPR-Cas system)